jgi:hypothetical protein
MTEGIASRPNRSFWIITLIALVWNVVGIMAYVMSATMSEENLAAMGEAERILYTSTPSWVTGAYAIAVFGGTFACIALLLRKSWTMYLFVVSLIAIVVQMGYGLFMSDMLEVRGAGAAALPVVVAGVAAYLLWFSRSARQKGWLSG